MMEMYRTGVPNSLGPKTCIIYKNSEMRYRKETASPLQRMID